MISTLRDEQSKTPNVLEELVSDSKSHKSSNLNTKLLETEETIQVSKGDPKTNYCPDYYDNDELLFINTSSPSKETKN